ncbi:uncharacterized protein IL334_004840 [Kwoniella shivajii]|uniref:SH3 domain-containing protein n=1 Tax=Kwoniella shivajii TaxID=564305 RepID=A0ABZ1D4G9_9TREE|nr:hypothetical protein IL334_004840 [Kwoniella shivajii]
MSYPYLARTILKYKSPHATDLSFLKDETIRVTGPSDDDEDWLIGENIDGSKKGGFPKDFITPIEEEQAGAGEGSNTEHPTQQSEPALPTTTTTNTTSTNQSAPPVSINIPAPPSPTLEATSRLPTPAMAPSPVPPTAEPSTSDPAPAPAPTSAPAPTRAPVSTEATNTTSDSPPKPQSMKDRLAFFAAAQNKPAPPPIKPKPAAGGLTWSQRQKLRQEQEAKERESNPNPTSTPAAHAPAPAPVPSQPAPITSKEPAASQPKDEEKKDEGKGMSAADALSSITKGGSLKERMAALQGQGAFGSNSTPNEESKSTAPPPVSSGKVWKRPPAPEPEPEADTQDTTEQIDRPESVRSPIAEQGDSIAHPREEGSTEEQAEREEDDEDEEEKEKARRAAIAARMAKLGARGPMGMMPPAKPARKPTKEALSAASSPVEEKREPVPESTSKAEDEVKATPSADETAADSAGPPKSIPIPAVPRRTAPPRRRGPAATPASTNPTETARENPPEPENRFETTDESGAPIPPPQVMVAGEDDPLPKTQAGLEKEKEDEEIGKGVGGLEGAAAAGIALAPVDPITSFTSTSNGDGNSHAPLAPRLEEDADKTLVGAIGGAESVSRGTGTLTTEQGEGQGEIIDESSPPVQEVEEGIFEGGEEKDDVMKQAQRGNLEYEAPSNPLDLKNNDEPMSTPLSPIPIGMVPIHPPAEDGSGYDEDEPPHPSPRRGISLDMPLDEVELKHEHEHELHNDEEIDNAPAPPPRRLSLDKPLGPRPLPSPGKIGRALPPPPTCNSLIPPRDDSEEEDEEDDDIRPQPPARLPPPPAQQTQEEEEEEEEEEGDDADQAPPPPPARHIPPPGQDDEQEQEEEDEDEDEAPPPPPPVRKPSAPTPLQVGIPTPASAPKSPIGSSPTISTSPMQSRTLASQESLAPSKEEDDDDASRRSGIAARMARLGGIKFGMPPPTLRKQSQNVSSPTTETPVTDQEHLNSPIDKEPPLPSPKGEPPLSPISAVGAQEGEETPEQEAARRRATLARLRAGGALGGFGLFNQGSSHAAATEEIHEDSRGLAVDNEPEANEEDASPPPAPPARPVAPSGPPALGPPANAEDEDEAPPPPPPTRPMISTANTTEGETTALPPRLPQSPISPIPPSPVRTPSGRRPPVPSEKRFSHSYKRSSTSSSAVIPENQSLSTSGDLPIADEPAVMASDQFEEDQAPPPPPPLNRSLPPQQSVPDSPRRSMSTTSRASRQSFELPPSTPSRVLPQQQQQQQVPSSPVLPSPARQSSVSQTHGNRPGFDQLKEASATHGAQLARSAQGIFNQGRKAYVGDGSPIGFVYVAMDNAKLPRPIPGQLGQVIFEQEGGSIMKRYDNPKPGDIAAFHDSKLKGKKGLTTYNQHVGSVEDPLVGIVAEFEERKHKLKVYQVERGVPEEVSYRCEDLKSGRIVVYRLGL